MIITSRSAVSTYQQCPRRRYWAYEAPNGTDVAGWERKRLALPLVTGIYTHLGLQKLLGGVDAATAARLASDAYRQEVASRGLAVEQGSNEADVVEEQAAHVEALTLGWARVRLPVWLDEYEVVETEQEDRVPLSDDVTLAVRADAIVKRRADGRMFVVNFKTVGTADERWLRAWEVDMQLMTELLAAEHRHGQEFGGVIIEGLVKGRRVAVDRNLSEIKGDKGGVSKAERVAGYIDSSRLLYGYKCDADPPLTPLQYAWEGTTRKGWHKFKTWREHFPHAEVTSSNDPRFGTMSPLQYWINWLPAEVVESQFVVVPPIYRDRDRIESCVRQIVAIERDINIGMEAIRTIGGTAILDDTFVQNTHACSYPSICPCYNLCWERGTSSDPAGSGLYQARHDHHALPDGGE